MAIDKHGNLAAATSTGGITGKFVGRVGDSPILGAGTYATNEVGAVSATGTGESIMKACLAYDILKRMQFLGENVQTASTESVKMMTDKFPGDGGVISLDKNGNVGIAFTSERMVKKL